MNLGLKSLEKLIKGQKRPKKAKEINNCHSRPKLQKTLILSLFNVKSSIYWNEMIRKSDFLEVFRSWNFSFSIHKFLKLHFVKKVKISEDFWYNKKFCIFTGIYIPMICHIFRLPTYICSPVEWSSVAK